MTTRYFVMYDVCDPKRLRRVYELTKGAGEHVQLSVFCCDLSDRRREQLMSDLSDIVNATEDQVLFIALGPSTGPAAGRVEAVGRPYSLKTDGTFIL